MQPLIGMRCGVKGPGCWYVTLTWSDCMQCYIDCHTFNHAFETQMTVLATWNDVQASGKLAFDQAACKLLCQVLGPGNRYCDVYDRH